MAVSNITRPFRCVSITDAGQGRVNVNFQETNNAEGVQPFSFGGGGNLSINMTSEEATDHFPGKEYDVAITLRS